LNTPVINAPELSDQTVAPQDDLALATIPRGARIGRRLLLGSGIYAVTSFAVKGINFLLLAVYSRFLTPADYGIVSLADTVSAVVVAISGVGLTASLVRLYFQHSGNRERLQNFLGTLVSFTATVNVAVLLVACAAGFVFDRILASRAELRFFPYIALSLGAAVALQFTELRFAIYQAESQAHQYALLSFAAFAFTSSGILVLVVAARWGAYGFLLGKLLGAVCAAVLAVLLLRSWWRLSWNWDDLRESLRFGLPLVPHQLIALGLVAADRFIVAHYAGLADVGVYSVAYTIGMVMYTLTAAVSLAWTPLFYDLASAGRHKLLSEISRALIFGLVACASAGALIARPFIGWFLDSRYSAAGMIVPWIIGGYLMHALFTLFQIAIMQAKKTSYLPWLSGIAFALNLALNFALVPRFGIYGAAWATFAAYALEAALVFVLAQKVFRLDYRLLELGLALAIFCAVLAATQQAMNLSGWALSAAALFCAALAAIIAKQLSEGLGA
jgi:O-antigen/teichoic acid export membrane protein